MEPHVYPPLLSRRLGDPRAILEMMVEAAAAAAGATGVGIGLLVAADRSGGPGEAQRWARRAARFAGRGVTTFGLAGDESRHPARPFGPAFAVARGSGLLSAPHGGELAGPDAVRATLAALTPHRLAHGVRIAEDEAVMEAVAGSGVVCDVCPSSNVALGVYRSIGDHPLPRLLAAGVPVTLNADDPLFFDSSLAGEYERARRDLALSDEDLARIARTSIEASAAPTDVKAAARAGISAWIGTGAAAPGGLRSER